MLLPTIDESPLCVLDASLRFRAANLPFAAVGGLSLKDLQGREWGEVVPPPTERGPAARALQAGLRGEINSTPLVVRGTGRVTQTLRAELARLRSPNGRALLLVRLGPPTRSGAVAARPPDGSPGDDRVFKKLLRARVGAAAERRLLTARETEVLHLMIAGRRTPEVVTALAISRGIAKFHIANVFRKMGVASRVDLLRVVLHGEDPG
jgi:DNA-binding CsgD family transcriptional regulator